MGKKSIERIKEEYPNITSEKIKKSFKKGVCPNCGRKLHKALTGQRNNFYCTCNIDFIID